MDEHEKKLLDFLADDNSKQVSDWHYAERLFQMLGEPKNTIHILDLGAGKGASQKYLKRSFKEHNFEWRGVDISDSDEVLSRTKDVPDIDFYNGVDLPYDDNSFDVVWSRQVLEHVRYPDKVIAEVARVLKSGGCFTGSVSQLEPYHSRSIFNWTHYGVMTVLADHGLDVTEMRAGIDGATLMIRSLFGRRSNLSRFFRTEAPLNILLEQMFVRDVARARNVRMAQFQKLKAAGHIHFFSTKRSK